MASFPDGPVQHYTTRDHTGYRGNWRDPPQIDSRVNRVNPGRANLIISEMIVREQQGQERAQVSYQKKVSEYNPALDTRKNGTLHKHPDWMERSLPTNIPDHPASINVNSLRSAARPSGFPGVIDGIKSFASHVAVGNWVEERADTSYKGSLPAALSRPNKHYETEYSWASTHARNVLPPPQSAISKTLPDIPRDIKSHDRKPETEYVFYQAVPAAFDTHDTEPRYPLMRPATRVKTWETSQMAAYIPPQHQTPAYIHPDKEISKFGDDLAQYRNRWTRSSTATLRRMETEYRHRYLRPRTDPGATGTGSGAMK